MVDIGLHLLDLRANPLNKFPRDTGARRMIGFIAFNLAMLALRGGRERGWSPRRLYDGADARSAQYHRHHDTDASARCAGC